MLVEDLSAEKERETVKDTKGKGVKGQVLPTRDIKVNNVKKANWIPKGSVKVVGTTSKTDLGVKDIKVENVQKEKWSPRKPVSFVYSTSSHKASLGYKNLGKKNNSRSPPTNVRNACTNSKSTPHLTNTKVIVVSTNAPTMNNMPTIDVNHKACYVKNCMSCAFNVMSAYFKSMHASSSKTSPRQHMSKKRHVKSKTVSPPVVKKETVVPKPKQKVVKAVYRIKGTVKDVVAKVLKIGSVVQPEKGQFFKYAGPNQLWVPKIT